METNAKRKKFSSVLMLAYLAPEAAP